MKPYLLTPDAPATLAGEILHEQGWTLADVLEWMAGKKCTEEAERTGMGHVKGSNWVCAWTCSKCFADPPAEYGRDVLCAFIENGGATHPIHSEWADWIRKSLFRVQGEGEYQGAFVGVRGVDEFAEWFHPVSAARLALKRRILKLFSGPVEEGGVRILKNKFTDAADLPHNMMEIVPEQLLPTDVETERPLYAETALVR